MSPPNPVDKASNPESPQLGFPAHGKIESSKVGGFVEFHLQAWLFKESLRQALCLYLLSAANRDQEDYSHLGRAEEAVQHKTGI